MLSTHATQCPWFWRLGFMTLIDATATQGDALHLGRQAKRRECKSVAFLAAALRRTSKARTTTLCHSILSLFHRSVALPNFSLMTRTREELP